MHATQIYQWPTKTAHEKSVGDCKRQLREANARLNRQLAEKSEEVEILGKTAASFAKKLD